MLLVDGDFLERLVADSVSHRRRRHHRRRRRKWNSTILSGFGSRLGASPLLVSSSFVDVGVVVIIVGVGVGFVEDFGVDKVGDDGE